MSTPPTPLTRNISIDDETDAIIEKVNAEHAFKNYSAAVRFIVRQWVARGKEIARLERKLEQRATPSHAMPVAE